MQLSQTHAPGIAIPDNSPLNGAYDSFNVTTAVEVERVEVTLRVTHTYIGDLSVLLTSPSGVTSFLVWRPQQNALSAFGSSLDNINFTFDTVLDWGEISTGTWLLGIYDNASGDVGTFDSWTLNIIGKPASADDTYIYTDEFAESVADQAARATLTDSGGIDTLNAAACSAGVLLNLNPGAVCTIDGRSLTLGAATVIENAFGGDGGDVIQGNAAANTLYGMRSNDSISAGAGDDLLCGGAGNDTLDGGSGTDTALYAGLRRDYTVAYVAATSTYTVTSTAEGVDTLSNVERVRFADGEFAITALGNYHASAGGDFNGDGRADILWRNDSGYVAMWQMNGLAIGQGGGVASLPGNWTIADSAGDYNGDGRSDILWRNDSGYVAMWQMNGLSILAGGGVSSLPADWHIVSGAGDYNGDGRSDILWRNDSGYVAVWLMDGFNIIGGGGIASLPNDWHIESGAGDYNGDGKSDILWRNDSGYVAMWQMNDVNIIGSGGVGTLAADWHVVSGAGDYNGDGRSDILWRNDSGYVAAWLMNGLAIATGSGIASLPNDWHIADGAGDYNGDGRSDILWRNDSGYVALWQMNGVNIVGSGGIGSLTADWHVMPQG